MAAAAALGASAGIWLARPATNSPPAAITLSGANPVTHVRVTATLIATSWSTSIRLQASGLPLNQLCRLIVCSRAGATEIAGAWDAWRSGPVSIPASAAWRPADIVSLQVATTTRSLVTVSAVRPGEAQAPINEGVLFRAEALLALITVIALTISRRRLPFVFGLATSPGGLWLSEHTVHRHLANILRKLNLSSRAAAAAWGVRAGLV